MKPYKGEIRSWKIVEFADGRIATGVPVGHPVFVNFIRTSPIVRMKDSDGYWDVETMNSRYKLYYNDEKAND